MELSGTGRVEVMIGYEKERAEYHFSLVDHSCTPKRKRKAVILHKKNYMLLHCSYTLWS